MTSEREEIEDAFRAGFDYGRDGSWTVGEAWDCSETKLRAEVLPPVAPAGDFLAENAKNAPAGDREAVRYMKSQISNAARRTTRGMFSVEDAARSTTVALAWTEEMRDRIADLLNGAPPAQPAEERAVVTLDEVRALVDSLRSGLTAGSDQKTDSYLGALAAVANGLFQIEEAALSRARTGSEAQNG